MTEAGAAKAPWTSLCADLETIMKPRGLDILIPMSVGMYNAVAPDGYKIPAAETSLLVMIGNTKHLWPHFVASIDLENIPDHPLNEFAVREVTAGLAELSLLHPTPAEKVYWVHDMAPGKMIAAIRMVVASGFASFSSEAHLSVHPTYGPWFGLRAAIVFPCDGPSSPVFHAPERWELTPDVSAHTTELYNRAVTMSSTATSITTEAKLTWFQLRTGIAPHHPYMYSDAQVRFHYANSPDARAKVLASVKHHIPIDFVLEDPSEAVMTCRRLFQTVLQETAAQCPDTILLSGGLDTSILAEATAAALVDLTVGANNSPKPILSVQSGITVRADPAAQDAVYAKAICGRVGMPHLCLDTSVEVLLAHGPHLCRALETFDPMELRNSIVVYHALRHAADQGYTSVVTGDGADELFAGYSFYHGMDATRLRDYREKIARIMHFSATKLAGSLNLRVLSPYLDPRVVAFALSLEKDGLVGMKTPVPNGKVHGKLILRQAFPEAYSQWRDKEPIEQGAGTSQLRLGYFESRVDDATFAARRHAHFVAHDVVLRDKEHVFFFEQFLAAFDGDLTRVPKTRYGDDPCPACHFQLPSRDQAFCVTCGFWPARVTDVNAETARRALDDLAAQVDAIKAYEPSDKGTTTTDTT
ncbi:Aste57867_13209 [Aphanomyces stellatus]|uniref:Aste57867_13209 protein n=1 Tax=Aphanomyces stellatus TaxID=120398 RepID=A0A485KZ82_9STRA|nr:hypothetical protein As57867_013160 [Aphanomyces stellatus]VFT90049.1 Aste57867_13209 [Aphanomyces stellatus]